MEVIGTRKIPLSPIRKGSSLEEWEEPRYLTTRRRRVDTCAVTRWSRRMTQSATYSSSPWRVIVLSPRSPVITEVTPFSLSHRNRRLSSDLRMPSLWNPPKSDSTVSSTTRLAPMESMAWERRTNRPSRSYSPVSSISLLSTRTWSTSIFFRAERSARSKPSDATFCASSLAFSSKDMKTPGSPCSRAPRMRNSMENKVFPLPALPATSVGRPLGNPPPVISSKPLIPLGHFGREPEQDPALILFFLIDPPPRIGWRPSPFPMEAELSVAGKKIQSVVRASAYKISRFYANSNRKNANWQTRFCSQSG